MSTYQAYIDGIRALAILLVLAFHFFPGRFYSGFLGVDIFFVISGYLITLNIFNEMEKESFSFLVFYQKRIRRLFPALILVLTAVFTFGWWILYPHEFARLGFHVLGGGLFFSNLILLRESGYFDSESLSKPLHHLWSLGVEEQYYLVWPAVFFLIFLLGKKFSLYLLVLIGFSLLAGSWFSFLNPEAAFFNPLARLFELLIGSSLALAEFKYSSDIKSAFGVLLIFLGLYWIHDARNFLNLWMILPCMGAALMISAGPDAWISKNIFSNPVLVYIGLISYPLYLWHWPLRVYAEIIGLNTGLPERFFLILTAFLLAIGTYELFEKKTRRWPLSFSCKTLIPAMALLVSGGILASYQYWEPRQNDERLVEIGQAFSDWSFPDGLKKSFISGAELFCTKNQGPKVLFMGDSHIQQYAPRLKILSSAYQACFYSDVYPALVYPNRLSAIESDKIKKKIQALALNPEFDRVVLGAYFNSWAERPPEEWKASLGPALTELLILLRDKEVFFLLDNPDSLSASPASCFKTSRFSKSDVQSERCAQKTFQLDLQQKKLDEYLRKIAQVTNAKLIDPKETLCPKGSCLAFSASGIPFYRDRHHLRASFVEKIAFYMDQTMRQVQ